MSALIEEFIHRYEREYDYYVRVAETTGTLCRKWLDKNGLRAMVTFRGKSPRSLKQKLVLRDETKHYESFGDIYRDIVDLAGVRIALYFPNNLKDVHEVLQRNLHIDRVVRFPEDKPPKLNRLHPEFKRHHKGYISTHYRARLKADGQGSLPLRFTRCPVEIQVASVLMHAWSEVEHDLVYKAESGDLSLEELQILDEINGIVTDGEAALQKLWQAGDRRLASHPNRIKNKYELAALLHYLLDQISCRTPWDIHVGEIEELMTLLVTTQNDTAPKLQSFLDLLPNESRETSVCKVLRELILDHKRRGGVV